MIKFNIRSYFSVLLTLYISSQIIFPLSENIIISNLLNVLLIVSYTAYIVIKKESSLITNKLISIYFLFTVYVFASSLWSIDFKTSISTVSILVILLITLIYIYNIAIKFNIANSILYGILIGGILNILLAYGLIDIYNPFSNPYRFVGTMARSTALSVTMILVIYSTIMLLNVFQSKYHKLLYFILFSSLYTILLSASKKGLILGTFLIFIYFLFKLKNIKNISYIILSLILGYLLLINFATEDLLIAIEKALQRFTDFNNTLESNSKFSSTGERLYFIERGLEILSNNPFLGTGNATFSLQNSFGYYSHNNYIEILSNLGLIGFFIYYSLYAYLFYIVSKNEASIYKKITLFFLISLLVMDLAAVSYNYKLIFYVLIFISLRFEKNIQKFKDLKQLKKEKK